MVSMFAQLAVAAGTGVLAAGAAGADAITTLLNNGVDAGAQIPTPA